jgi:hypothetical protein
MRLLVQHIGAVSSLWGVPDSIRSQIAGAVAAHRKLGPDVALLFGHDAPTELVIPDCHQLDPAAMLALLRLLLHGIEPGSEAGGGADTDSASKEGTPAGEGAAHRLERLVLGSCGRGFDAKAAAALEGAGPLPALRLLHLGGAYRLADDGLLALLAAAPGLQELAVPSAPRLTGVCLRGRLLCACCQQLACGLSNLASLQQLTAFCRCTLLCGQAPSWLSCLHWRPPSRAWTWRTAAACAAQTWLHCSATWWACSAWCSMA